MLLTHVDLIEKLLEYNRMHQSLILPLLVQVPKMLSTVIHPCLICQAFRSSIVFDIVLSSRRHFFSSLIAAKEFSSLTVPPACQFILMCFFYQVLMSSLQLSRSTMVNHYLEINSCPAGRKCCIPALIRGDIAACDIIDNSTACVCVLLLRVAQ
jgi:hypothetical protein